LDAPVVEALRKALACAGGECVEAAGTPLRKALLGQLVQRVWPVMPVDEIEVRIARVVGDRPPVLRVLHAMDNRAITTRRLAEAAAVRAAAKRAHLAIDERNQLAREIVRVVADRRGVDVLIAAERCETVGEDDDRGPHLPLVDEPRRALGHVVSERAPAGVCNAGAREADQIVEYRKGPATAASALACAVVVLR